ncbi:MULTISPECIES: D-Ala-D-Ala carboxypeptidase family metallohydrolase [unclassified Bradyrhizobium]|uniref:D-Ala-D-Ala carboxypeptidase family metallohydrolase n=1 Tax=unclassified Bradyrhizobium TaxID=2631580 RepID=UPI0028E906D9|nr:MULTISPECIES: D-Ala-D-Ala carboxypeptidase family metallohydrolase [unclassified Bradyrhizobium]
MAELDDLIDEAREKLRAAYAEAEGNAQVQQGIREQLIALADLQEDIALGELLRRAAILNKLSAILEAAIETIKHNIANFFLDDLKELKDKIDRKSGAAPGRPASPNLGGRPAGPVVPPPPPPPPPIHPPAQMGRVLLGRAPAGCRDPSGPLVMALQAALIRAGQALEPDGAFGNITAGALRRWQKANGFEEHDGIDEAQWKKLTRSDRLPAPFDICLNITADYEGTSFDRVVGNFDGAGITFGLIGFTLANGEIGRLLTRIEAMRPGSVATAFGALYPQLMSILSATKAERLAWADSISLGANKYDVAKPWKDAFKRVGSYPQARRAQIEHAYDVYWKAARSRISDFMPGKPLTMQDAAFWFDAAVQNALDDEERDLLKQAGHSAATGRQLRGDFAKIIADGSSPRWRRDVLSRKMTFVDGTGAVHGSQYALDSWGVSSAAVAAADLATPSAIIDLVSSVATAPQDDITAPSDEAGEAAMVGGAAPLTEAVAGTSPHAGWPLYARFAAFIAQLGLRHFDADELLYLGSQNAGGTCKGLNTYPPETLWPNIAPTAAVLDKLREELNVPIRILSVYRSPLYNRCIDGSAVNSFHMQFKAVDFACDSGSPAVWAAKLKEYRSRGVFAGGIGVYRSFVHVDTRGYNADWTG